MLKIVINILIVLFGFLLLFWYFFSDTQTNIYKNIQEVQDDKAIIRGWIPNILPITAYNIEETHNLDTNTIFGSFKYLEIDEENFIKNLTFLTEKKNTMMWNGFIFKIDREKNYVKFKKIER